MVDLVNPALLNDTVPFRCQTGLVRRDGLRYVLKITHRRTGLLPPNSILLSTLERKKSKEKVPSKATNMLERDEWLEGKKKARGF